MRAALPVSETADGHRRPPLHWQTPRVMQSLTVAVYGHLIRSIPHHAVIAMQQRESSLSPCAQPSTLGHGSATVQIPARPRTPANADRAVKHHIPDRCQFPLSPDQRSYAEGTALTILARTKWCSGMVPDLMNVERALAQHIRGICALSKAMCLIS